MKKLIVLSVVLLAFTTTYAQNHFGIKGGVNFANLAVDRDQVDENSTKTGFSVGVVNRSTIDNAFFLQSEILYTRKGAKYEVAGTSIDANLDYLELPITFHLQILGSPLNVYAGGYASYLLNAKYEYELGDNLVEYDDRPGFGPTMTGCKPRNSVPLIRRSM